MNEDEYDDSPWTREELEALAWEAGKHLGWEDTDEYDDAPFTPPEEHLRELERRIAAADADPGAAESWEVVLARLSRKP
jgi:hypothetical protein